MAGRIAYLGNIVTQGLILNLDAAKKESYPGTGSVWYDLSPVANNSQILGGPSTTGSSVNNAIFLSTGSMYVACTTTADIGIARNTQFSFDPTGVAGSPTITIELWFNSNQTVFPNSYLLSKPWNGSGVYNYNIPITSTSSFRLNARLASGTISTLVTNTPIIDGTWKQFVYWITPTQYGFYINGNQYSGSFNHNISGSVPTDNALSGLALMTLYPYPGTANPSFSITGSLSNVKFYNRQLTQAEVVQNFNAYRSRYGI
jgi:hypothetical protein